MSKTTKSKTGRRSRRPLKRLVLQLNEHAYNAGRAEVQRLAPDWEQSEFKDRPKAIQRGFVVTVEYILEWARQNDQAHPQPGAAVVERKEKHE